MKQPHNVQADKPKSSYQSQSSEKAANAAISATANSASVAAETAARSVERHVEPPARPAHRLSAVESNINSPDELVQAGTAAVKDFISAGTQEAQKTQQKVLSLSNEGLQNLSKTADQTVRSLNDALAFGKEQLDALMESSKIASNLSREMNEKFVSDYNDMFVENVELSKDMLECRTLNDLVEIQNRALQSNLSRFFDQSANFAEAWFRLATEASEPLSTQANQVTSRLKRSLAA